MDVLDTNWVSLDTTKDVYWSGDYQNYDDDYDGIWVEEDADSQ